MIWIVGAKGMLGSCFTRRVQDEGLAFTATDREVDITDSAAVRSFASRLFGGTDPADGGSASGNWIVNCAAYTAVDRAEDEPEAAGRLNGTGAGNLAAAAVESGAGMLHISTDYVFDGSAQRPYTEDDPVCPASVYGRTKLEGEQLVRKAFSGSPLPWYIIRTAWLYGPVGKNFVYTMVSLMNTRPEIRVVSDQRGTPTFTGDLARCMLMLMQSGADAGIYHYSGEGETTWFDFASEIYRIGRQKGRITGTCAVNPCTSAEYPAKAARPAYSVLSKAKLRHALGVPLPGWEESLLAFMSGPDFVLPGGEKDTKKNPEGT